MHDTLHIDLIVGIDDRGARHHIEALLLVVGSSSSDNHVVRSPVETSDDAGADAVADRHAEWVVAEDGVEDNWRPSILLRDTLVDNRRDY